MKHISSCLAFVIFIVSLDLVLGQSFPKPPKDYSADCYFSFNDHGRSWSSSGKIWAVESQNSFRQDYFNKKGEKLQFFQMSKNMADFYLVTYSANPTCSRNMIDYPGWPFIYEDGDKAQYLGKVNKGNQVLDWWRWSNYDVHTNWYFDSRGRIARYEIADSWSYKKIDFKNVLLNEQVNMTVVFDLPEVCTK